MYLKCRLAGQAPAPSSHNRKRPGYLFGIYEFVWLIVSSLVVLQDTFMVVYITVAKNPFMVANSILCTTT
jgi:hypothetical protein